MGLIDDDDDNVTLAYEKAFGAQARAALAHTAGIVVSRVLADVLDGNRITNSSSNELRDAARLFIDRVGGAVATALPNVNVDALVDAALAEAVTDIKGTIYRLLTREMSETVKSVMASTGTRRKAAVHKKMATLGDQITAAVINVGAKHGTH